ncbi:hypothetical protein PR048_028006 [Dryococelus australis]|uniref:Uncharacterized protein n=1 Tax=Dryococelus australis TaxID=614101 RepID=A0ABQ9GI16_9NEOP|nr:hypothetical protein PR048_028006 [Dryococelus australis]
MSFGATENDFHLTPRRWRCTGNRELPTGMCDCGVLDLVTRGRQTARVIATAEATSCILGGGCLFNERLFHRIRFGPFAVDELCAAHFSGVCVALEEAMNLFIGCSRIPCPLLTVPQTTDVRDPNQVFAHDVYWQFLEKEIPAGTTVFNVDIKVQFNNLQFDMPDFVIVGFQTNRQNFAEQYVHASMFDHCNVSNIFVKNGRNEIFPKYNWNLDIENDRCLKVLLFSRLTSLLKELAQRDCPFLRLVWILSCHSSSTRSHTKRESTCWAFVSSSSCRDDPLLASTLDSLMQLVDDTLDNLDSWSGGGVAVHCTHGFLYTPGIPGLNSSCHPVVITRVAPAMAPRSGMELLALGSPYFPAEPTTECITSLVVHTFCVVPHDTTKTRNNFYPKFAGRATELSDVRQIYLVFHWFSFKCHAMLVGSCRSGYVILATVPAVSDVLQLIFKKFTVQITTPLQAYFNGLSYSETNTLWLARMWWAGPTASWLRIQAPGKPVLIEYSKHEDAVPLDSPLISLRTAERNFFREGEACDRI